MKTKSKLIYIQVLFAFITISSCKVSQPYVRPEVDAHNLFRDSLMSDTNSNALLPWRKLFADTILQKIIQEGISNNLNLQNAVLKIAEAEASMKQAKVANLPSLEAGLNASRTQSSVTGSGGGTNAVSNSNDQTQAFLNVSWEADIWGKMNSLKKRSVALFFQSNASKRVVETRLIASIANYYYLLLAYDKQLEITRQTIENRISDIETNKRLFQANMGTAAAIVQSEASRYAAEISVPDLEQRIRETENAISILISRPPGAIERNTLADQVPLTMLQAGLSTHLLKNRPDIQEAEYGFIAAFENTNAAKTYFYPSLVITAQGGLYSQTLKSIFNGSFFYSLTGGLTQPLFNKRENKTRYETARAKQRQAFNTYHQTILIAGQEVSDALFSHQQSLKKQELRKLEIDALEKSVKYTKSLLLYGNSTNYIDVLSSEQRLLTSQLEGVDDKLQQLQSTVYLYSALGGGWQ